MINLDRIEAEIDRLEMRPTSYYACSRLSTLYNVRDHLIEKMFPQDAGDGTRLALSGSDFLDAANGKPYEEVMRIVDEHMETIHTLYPKTYSALVERIRKL